MRTPERALKGHSKGVQRRQKSQRALKGLGRASKQEREEEERRAYQNSKCAEAVQLGGMNLKAQRHRTVS